MDERIYFLDKEGEGTGTLRTGSDFVSVMGVAWDGR